MSVNRDLELVDAVGQLIAEKLSVEHLAEDTDLLGEGILDSVTLVQLILHLEQRFGVRIELSKLEIEDLRSVRSIASLLTKLHGTGLRDDFELANATSSS
jgi:acyl carrier protein